ncbi:PREDICTED: uncharacterized protein LOC109228611 isoform X2 [Nicotiana attenuata]|uniref:uncharacterized protein LOC109228611 isoform X2 n=1 Tax=Nicotiana attenuata TaxID=49451 RepID=UPI000905A693|nr:PREDICTED: uncharacterized protein LOC109228611 isoform X2 [Nicotiana attenuata]
MSSPAALTTVAAGGTSEDRHQNHNNTENSEGGTTMAMQKKRARRVSFAEMTSVHFFDRDEEYETPPDPSGKAESNSEREEIINLGFDQLVDDSKESEDGDEGNDEDEDEDEDDEMALPRSFLRPAESPSPGSHFGSATSNDDEDNFFGPVSPNFIRPGRLSDSAVSDENHDITMDSTAFSMHFRRFVRSDSGIDLKTPTEVSFDEKTPTQTGLGNSMELTMSKKLISQSSMPVANFSGTSDSSDMSLIGENSRRYDYGRLPPDLEALLAEGQEKHAVSVSGDTSVLESPASKKMEVGSALMGLGGNGEQEANAIVSLNMPLVPLCQKIDDADDGNKFLSRAIDADTLPISTVPAPDNYVDRVNQSPKQLSKDVGENNKSVKDASEVGISEALCSNDGELGQFCWSPRGRESPLVDLVSSSPATQRLIVTGSPSPVKQNSMAVSFLEDPISFLSNEKRGPWTSSASLQKNISKLERLKASELSSPLGDRIPNMDIRSLEFPRTPPLDSILKKRNLQMGVKSLDSSMTCTEEQFSGTSMKEGERRMFTSGGSRSETLLTGEDVIPCEQSLGPEKQGKSLNRLNTGFLPVDQVLKPTAPLASSRFSWSGKTNDTFTPNDLRQKRSLISRTDSPLVDYLGQEKVTAIAQKLASSRFSWSGKTNDTFTPNDLRQKRSLISRTDSPLVDYLGQEKVTAIAQKLVFSPEKSLQSKSSTWTEHQSSPFKESKLHDEPMKSLGLVKNASSIGNVTDGHSSNAMDGNWHSSSTSTEEQSGSPVVEGSKVLMQPDGTYSIEAKLLDQMNVLKSTEDLKISRDGSSHLSSAILDGNFQSANGLPRFEIDPRELNKSPLAGAASSSIQNVEALVVEKTPVQWSSRSPPAKGFHVLAQSNTTCSSVGEAVQSPTCNQSIGRPRNSSAHKRCSEELTYGDMEHTNQIIMSQSSSKLQRGVGNSPGISGRPDDSRKEMLRAHLELRQWKDIKSKCLEDADEWISLPKERLAMLTMPAIEMVEDIVTRMQKAKTYDILHRQILTQKTLVTSFQEKRTLEAIKLLCQLVHEKAKYHWRCVKKKKLLEKCQLLNSGIQKSQMSKINHSLHITVSGVTQGDAISSESSLACEKALQEERHNKVATIKEGLEVSERKVAKLARSLRSSFKLEGEPSCAATIISVKEHLMRRSCCRFLRQDMQMCVIQNVRRPFVILNYLGLLVQSLKLTIGPNSSIIISNNLNDQLITKSFPNINACAALRFVLKAEISKKLGARTLAQEMQVTRSLLGNSLDVVAEVQKAQIQFHNLADIAFSTPTVEELELQLHFENYNTGKKVKLTLDMSCLNRGVYPSEVVPSQVAALALHAEHSDDALLGEIRAAVKNLRAGYMRIIRLCDCISRVVQASGG